MNMYRDTNKIILKIKITLAFKWQWSWHPTYIINFFFKEIAWPKETTVREPLIKL